MEYENNANEKVVHLKSDQPGWWYQLWQLFVIHPQQTYTWLSAKQSISSEIHSYPIVGL